MEAIVLEPVDALTDGVRSAVERRFIEGGQTDDALLGEHGFSALVTVSKSALAGAGFEIVEERQPSFLLDGSLLVTGEVDRTTDFERGFPGHQAHRHGEWKPDPLILDDQAPWPHCRPPPTRGRRIATSTTAAERATTSRTCRAGRRSTAVPTPASR
jgi:hypothetical protein